MAHQVAIQVTGRNLANVNNPEYSRQRVKMGDRYVDQTPHGPVGSGVEVLQVQQMRDAFLDAQVVRHASDTGSLDAQKTVLSNLELILGDSLNSATSPNSIDDATNSTTGLSAALDDFFNAFSTLASNPSDIPSKSAALNAAAALADRLNLTDQRVAASQADQEGQIQSDIAKANALLADIAELNFQIRQAADVETGGAVDLVDKRQAKLEELATYLKVDITKDPSNSSEVNLSLGGVTLVAQAQLLHQVGYLSESATAALSAAGSLGNRTQGFEIGDYDAKGNFTPAVVSNGGASMLRTTDTISGANFTSPVSITAKIDESTIQLSKTATATGYFALTVNGVPNARIGYSTAGSKIVTLSNTTGYEVIPTGGSAQGRFQATFGSPTSSYMTAKGIRTQLADLASQIRSQVNSIYSDASGNGLFVPSEVALTGTVAAAATGSTPAVASATVAGSRTLTVSDTSGLVLGMHIYGTGIPSGATVTSILNNTTFAISVPATATSTTAVALTAARNLLDVESNITASSLLSAPAGTPASANTFATKIAALRDALLSWSSPISGGASFTARPNDYSRGMLTSLAQTIRTVSNRAEESQVVGDAIKAQRDSVSGVSLDEETADLMRFQKAYQANAKVISVIDDMLASLIGMIR